MSSDGMFSFASSFLDEVEGGAIGFDGVLASDLVDAGERENRIVAPLARHASNELNIDDIFDDGYRGFSDQLPISRSMTPSHSFPISEGLLSPSASIPDGFDTLGLGLPSHPSSGFLGGSTGGFGLGHSSNNLVGMMHNGSGLPNSTSAVDLNQYPGLTSRSATPLGDPMSNSGVDLNSFAEMFSSGTVHGSIAPGHLSSMRDDRNNGWRSADPAIHRSSEVGSGLFSSTFESTTRSAVDNSWALDHDEAWMGNSSRLSGFGAPLLNGGRNMNDGHSEVTWSRTETSFMETMSRPLNGGGRSQESIEQFVSNYSVSQGGSILGMEHVHRSHSQSVDPSMFRQTGNAMNQKFIRSSTPGQNGSTKISGPSSSLSSMDDRQIESLIVLNCRQILMDAAEHSLKAVELANTLRARVGTEVLSVVRERFSGLLALLEKHSDGFSVERIPKSDRVSLKRNSLQSSLPSGGISSVSLAEADIGLVGMGDDMRVSSSDAAAHREDSSSMQPSIVNSESSGDLSTQQSASRCLHVGNVPTHYTEAHLTKEFEKFGHVENVKLISHKNSNRRFAFVTFRTVSHATMARHSLSKIQPWKSAISYAHKDFTARGNGGGGNMSGTNSGRVTPSYDRSSTPVTFADNHLPPRARQTYSQLDAGGSGSLWGVGPIGGMRQSVSMSSLYTMDIQSVSSHMHYSSRSNAASPAPPSFSAVVSGMSNLALNSSGIAPGNSIVSSGDHSRDQAILRRLCDDTYVPTQPWPVDLESDLPFCHAVTDQISQFGGKTTISKLRGFLKHRIGTQDNIKSVPLKAMLIAYPKLFRIEGNFVSLVSTSANAAVGSALEDESNDPSHY